MKLSIVIPNWNGIDWLADCLDAALAQTVPAEIIVVDNGSHDGSIELLRDHYPQVQLIARDKNYGFTGGTNPGFEAGIAAGMDAVALMNNDAIPAADWLEQLVTTLESNDKIGIVTAKIRHFEDERLDSTGDFYSIWGFMFPRGRGEIDTGQYDGPDQRVIFAASGGASLYRVAMLREIGVFDQRFFAYYEDVDLSFRARLAGWDVRYEPKAVVRHRIGGTSRRLNRAGTAAAAVAIVGERPSAFARYHTIKNFVYVYTKDMPGYLYWKYLPWFWASWILMVGSDLRRGLITTNLKASWTVLIELPGILISRHNIQKNRAVRPADIEKLFYRDLPPIQKQRFAAMRHKR